MYLTSVKVQGFKSFPDKLIISLTHGITVITGTNGCGKSNVVDAIRWALGEQSNKALRIESKEQVIFHGSENRKRMGYAEVSLTFDNYDNTMPISFSEVTITRRVFLNGESEYYINLQSCRLKDIHELLLSSGVGINEYSVIGQGAISNILNTSSKHRRALFDKATGIAKYKSRKVESEKKLEQVKVNLNRINEIVSALELWLNDEKVTPEEQVKYKERYDFMALQKNDMENSKEKIEKVISDLDSEMTEKFNTQFRSINDGFRKHVSELFGGAHAEVSLQDKDNPIESKIDIKVQLPGKSLQKLDSLADREKALISFALILSILDLRETPMCIIDGIEASLDDESVSQIFDYIKRYKESIQFIFTTQNEVIIKEANTVYEINIHEQDVSKVDNESRVLQWINDNFDITQIQIEDYILPHSKIVKSKGNGDLLVYWDIIEDKIRTRPY